MGKKMQAGPRVMNDLGGQAKASAFLGTRTQKLRKIKVLN